MELEFLNTKTDEKNLQCKESLKIAEETRPFVDVKYGKTKATLQDEGVKYPIPLDLPYIKSGIEYGKSFGYKVCFGLKTALIARANGEKVMTVRECDIAFRRRYQLNNKYLQSVMMEFTGFLSEDNQYLTEGVFDTRTKYNKGLTWRKFHRKDSTTEQQEKGDLRIATLEKMLIVLGLPLHEEEKTTGLHPEFLKPEHLSWDQHNERYKEFTASKSLAVRLHLQEIETAAKELSCAVWKNYLS